MVSLIGITAAAMGSLAFLMVSGLIGMLFAWYAGFGPELPGSLKRWDLLPILFFFYLGGVLFWNCFYAAIASVINDPNTSSRTSLMFLPMLPMIAAGLVINQPDGLIDADAESAARHFRNSHAPSHSGLGRGINHRDCLKYWLIDRWNFCYAIESRACFLPPPFCFMVRSPNGSTLQMGLQQLTQHQKPLTRRPSSFG